MTISDETREAVLSAYLSGVKPVDIVRELKVSYSTVYKVKKDFEEADTNHLIQATCEQLGIEEKALTDGCDGLNTLGVELQKSALMLNNKCRRFMNTDIGIKDFEILSRVLTNLQTAFFNKAVTQVNIQTNHHNNGQHDNNGQTYRDFLSDKPVVITDVPTD